MNRNIKQLIENYIHAFNPAVLDDGHTKSKIHKDITNDLLTPYAPKNNSELREAIKKLYKQGSTDFNYIDISNVDDLFYAFKGLIKLEEIDISFWDVSHVRNMIGMFYGCKNLKYIHTSNSWDVSNVTDMNSMFCGCESLEVVEGLDDWNVNDNCTLKDTFHNVPDDIIPDWFKDINYPAVDINAVLKFNDVIDIDELESLAPKGKRIKNKDGTYTLWFEWYAYLVKNGPQKKTDLLIAFRLSPTSYGTGFADLNRNNIIINRDHLLHPVKIQEWKIKEKYQPWL